LKQLLVGAICRVCSDDPTQVGVQIDARLGRAAKPKEVSASFTSWFGRLPDKPVGS